MKFGIQANLITSLTVIVCLLLNKSQSLESRSFLRSVKDKEEVQQVDNGNGNESSILRWDLEDIDCADIFDMNEQDNDDDDDEAEEAELERLLLKKKRILCVNQEDQGKIEEMVEDFLPAPAIDITALIPPPEDADEITRTVFGNQQYLQLCSSLVFTTTICITIRYPFPVSPPPADGPNLRYVDPRYYDLTGLEIIDDEKLIPYRNLTATDDNVKKSLDDVASSSSSSSSPFGEGEPTVAVAVFTVRKKGQEEFGFFGTRSDEQFHRNSDFFGMNGKVIFYGDSKIGEVGPAIANLFHTCRVAPKVPTNPRLLCDAEKKNRRQMGFAPWDAIDQSKIFLGKIGITDCHLNFTEKVLDMANNMKDPTATSLTPLKKLTIIAQHSIAHIVRQPDLLQKFDETVTYQKDCVNGTLGVTSPETKAALADLGYELNPLIVFDGITQHFPTETGAYTPEINNCKKSDYGPCDGLPGFNIEEHGPVSCRGPVPRSSLFQKFLETERTEFRQMGFDMRWYGKTWEFTNLIWWQHIGWGGGVWIALMVVAKVKCTSTFSRQ